MNVWCLNDGELSRINDYLEEGLSEGKISKNLYNHLKGKSQIQKLPKIRSSYEESYIITFWLIKTFAEGLIESVVDGMREDVGNLSNSDYAHYWGAFSLQLCPPQIANQTSLWKDQPTVSGYQIYNPIKQKLDLDCQHIERWLRKEKLSRE